MERTQYVGMDVHKETITIPVFSGADSGPDFEKEFTNNKKAIKPVPLPCVF